MKVTLVILALNEITGLEHLFASIPQSVVDEVIAIDGGSTDGTVSFLLNKGIPVFVQEKSGRGEAFRLAFEKSHGEALIFLAPMEMRIQQTFRFLKDT